MTDDALTSRANVVLHLDNGAEMQFSGRPFAGGSWFDDETGELTRQKLYTTESGSAAAWPTAFPCTARLVLMIPRPPR